ncbi:MAG: hypothetical protein OXI87_03435 [Albidovulum sp.]|nr:hypothetical protein [Albidovulum sp.]
MTHETSWQLAHNIRRTGHLDIPGGGPVVVQDGYAYVGHMKPPNGTSIIDVRNPEKPEVVAHLEPPDSRSHTHKVRVAGNVMIANVEQDQRHSLRKSAKIAEISRRLEVEPSDVAIIEAANARGFGSGGIRVWDVSDKRSPKLPSYVRTHGFGVHRFDMDSEYAYISTEMEGYVGNILFNYDIRDPSKPIEISRWRMQGQHITAGETPSWCGYGHRLHHAMRCGDELRAAVWHAVVRVLDASDLLRPRVIGSYRFPEAIPEPTHTVMPLEQRIGGRRYAVAVDEEHDHKPGRLRGFLWVLDVTDLSRIEPVAAWDLSERASPWSGNPGTRFGSHQYRERFDSALVYATWFASGLGVLDLADPRMPVEAAHYIPQPGPDGTPPQSNDVDVDEDGTIYLIDRGSGFDIPEANL